MNFKRKSEHDDRKCRNECLGSQIFLVVSHDSIRGCVRPSVRRSVGRSVRQSVRRLVRNLVFRRAETKTANDLFRVYELVSLSLFPYFWKALVLTIRLLRLAFGPTDREKTFPPLAVICSTGHGDYAKGMVTMPKIYWPGLWHDDQADHAKDMMTMPKA